MCFGGSDKATTQTQSTQQLPQYVQNAQQNLINLGQQMTSPFLATPAYSVAGINTDQQAAFDGYRDLFINTQNNPGPGGQAAFTAAGPATNAMAARLNGGDIAEFQNPYTGQVIDATLDKMRQEKDKSSADIGARMAAASAFGGSREAVQRSLLDKNYGQQVAQTAAQLRAQGFDKASGLAQNNAQMAQQANMQNASAANQVNLTNASAQNTLSQANAQRAMQAYNDWYSHMLQANQGLLAVGNQKQQNQQAAIDAPWTALQRLVGTTPSLNNTGSTTSGTTTQPVQNNTMGNILGLGMMGLSLFSDERAKTNIEKLGKDPQTGLDIIAYDDKHDVAQAKKTGQAMPPKRVSIIAQQVEKMDPRAVNNVGGNKVVNAPMLAQILGAR